MRLDMLAELRHQAEAFRAAVTSADPNTTVPTCPEWTVLKLLRHLGRVYHMTSMSLALLPGSKLPRVPAAPEDFGGALAWWDDQLERMLTQMSTMDPDQPSRSFTGDVTVGWWIRRQAHETAIHHLDAQYARAETGPDHVQELLFTPDLAADGVDEILTELLAGSRDWPHRDDDGTVLYHAADAGRTWLVTFRAGEAPEVGAPHDAALGADEVDTTVAGTADAIYRRVWGRPSHAVISGNQMLADIITGR